GMVVIVDDDQRMCEALQELVAAQGLASVAFNSIDEYMTFPRPEEPCCLVLDIWLPNISGLEFQRQAGDEHPPILVITARGDIPSSVRAIKRGAVNFLTKPFSEAELMESIHAGLERDRHERQVRAELEALRRRLASLTVREREVLPLIVSGLLNKQAAEE